ncbi:MAG: hypothetical protein AAF391_02835 [Bacteroidota bacterium]
MGTTSKPSEAISILIFKTSIRSKEDLQKVSPFMDSYEGIKRWTIDLDDWEKVLKVESQGLELIDVEILLAGLGFECSELTH